MYQGADVLAKARTAVCTASCKDQQHHASTSSTCWVATAVSGSLLLWHRTSICNAACHEHTVRVQNAAVTGEESSNVCAKMENQKDCTKHRNGHQVLQSDRDCTHCICAQRTVANSMCPLQTTCVPIMTGCETSWCVRVRVRHGLCLYTLSRLGRTLKLQRACRWCSCCTGLWVS